jgi:hypothetical protein
MKLYHATKESSMQRYHAHTYPQILPPVRGFTSIAGAVYWGTKHGRPIVLEIEAPREVCHKLPDHHNTFGEAWWVDDTILKWETVKYWELLIKDTKDNNMEKYDNIR